MTKQILQPLKLIFAITLFLLFAPAASTQEGVNLEFNEFDYESFPNLGAIVTVINDSGVPYQNLQPDDFQAFEDGRRVEIKNINEEVNKDVEIAVVLAIDGSGSMGANNFTPWNQAKESAINFLESLEDKDQAALVVFGDEVNINEANIHPVKEAAFTTDKKALIDQINNLPNPVVGETTTPLYDAAYKAVRLAAGLKGSSGKRAVILFTDGREGNASDQSVSKLDQSEAINQAQTEHIPVFSIALGTEPDVDYLQRLANLSGGNFRQAAAASELEGFYQEISNKLKTQYKLTTTSNIRCDNREHGLEIKVRTEDGETVNTETFEALCPTTPGIQFFYEKPSEVVGEEGTQELLVNNFEIPQDEAYELFKLIPVISARNSIDRVEYFIDDATEPDFTATRPPFRYSWDTTLIQPGEHTIRIVVYDDQEPPNIGEATITVDGGMQGEKSTGPSPTAPIGIPLWVWVILIVIFMIVVIALALLFRHRRSPQEQRQYQAEPDIYDSPAPIEPLGPGPFDFTTGSFEQIDEPTTKPVSSSFSGMPIPPAGPAAPPPFQQGAKQNRAPSALPPGTIAFLVVEQGSKPGFQYPLGEYNTIGRDDSQCNVVLNDSSISRQHARIKQQGPKTFYVYDLASTNPVRVNGEKTTSMRLEDGDKIELGRVKLVFKQVK